MSVLSSGNKDSISKILSRQKLEKIVHLLKMLNKKSFVDEVFHAGCQYFEEDYILENIVLKMKENKELLQVCFNFWYI